MSKAKRDIRRKPRVLNHAKKIGILGKLAVILGFHVPFSIVGEMPMIGLVKKD